MSVTRREWVKTMGIGALGTSIAVPAGFSSTAVTATEGPSGTPAREPKLKTYDNLPVRVNNPAKLKGWAIPAVRTEFGEGYKPSLAMLPDGELVMVSLSQVMLPGKKFTEQTPIWRSKDGGITWSGPVVAEDMIGREHWLTCTSGGVLLTTCHWLTQDIKNHYGFTPSFVHRSTDRGRTWQRTRIVIEGQPEKLGTVASRNIVELPDKTLVLGVAVNTTSYGALWRSRNVGETWEKAEPVKIGGYHNRPYDNWDGFFTENWFYREASGKLQNFFRCGPPSPMYPMEDGRVTPKENDGGDRTLRCESTDEGRTWTNLRDFGNYGVMYPRILRLADGRLLMTFTQRSLLYPLGIQAIFSYDNGETWSWDQDHLIIDGKTPWGMPSGGGFGNTVQLLDGTLVSCYSYHAADDKKYIEVARWKLPA